MSLSEWYSHKYSLISPEESSLNPIILKTIKLFKLILNWDHYPTNTRSLSCHECRMAEMRATIKIKLVSN